MIGKQNESSKAKNEALIRELGYDRLTEAAGLQRPAKAGWLLELSIPDGNVSAETTETPHNLNPDVNKSSASRSEKLAEGVTRNDDGTYEIKLKTDQGTEIAGYVPDELLPDPNAAALDPERPI